MHNWVIGADDDDDDTDEHVDRFFAGSTQCIRPEDCNKIVSNTSKSVTNYKFCFFKYSG